MMVSLQEAFIRMVILGVISTPIFSYQELASLFAGHFGEGYSYATPVYIKALKDVLFLLLALLGIWAVLNSERIKKKVVLFLSLILIVLLVPSLLSYEKPLITIVAGYRWAFPLVLILLVYPLVDKKLLMRLSNVLLFVFVLHICTQFAQFFFGSAWYGQNSFGYATRNPGLFLMPSTGAFFTVTCLLYFSYFSGFSKKKIMLLYVVSAISVVLTSSGVGIVVLASMMLILVTPGSLLFVLPIIILGQGVLFLSLLNYLLDRGANYVEKSGGTRVEIFMREFDSASLFSHNFGFSTNTAVLLGDGKIVDSWFTSVLANTGMIGLFSVLLLFVAFGGVALVNRSKAMFSVLILVAGFGATIIWTEAYPMNLLVVLLVSYYVDKRYYPLLRPDSHVVDASYIESNVNHNCI